MILGGFLPDKIEYALEGSDKRNGSIEKKELMVRAFGFKSCKLRKWCNAYGLRKQCKYFRPGDPFKDKVCCCPENFEIPDGVAEKIIIGFAVEAAHMLKESLDTVVEETLKDRRDKQ